MLNVKKLLTKILNNALMFRGADGVNSASLGTSSTSITPTHDGWLVVAGKSTVSSGYAPVIRIYIGQAVLAEGTGILYNGGVFYASALVKKGVTYTVEVYRATFDAAYLHWGGAA